MKDEYQKQFEERAKIIVSKMRLSEKVSQLRHHSKALPKYNIREYNWWNECLHGVARAGLATVFPQTIGMAATFDENTLFKVGEIVSTEARAKHHEAVRNGSRKIYEGLTFWSPNINIYRDPRWGRGQETYGECPTLTSKLGCAYIEGLQGKDEKYLKVAACAKHYCAHSGPEADRHSFNAVVSSKDLEETYLYAFEKAVTVAKVESVMGAYNRVNGEACCASEKLLQGILRDRWHFKGHVVSDCGAVGDIIFHHKIAKNPIKGVAIAINSGLDLECGTYYAMLSAANIFKLVKSETIDKAVTRLLVTRMKLGMFDEDCIYNRIPYSMNATKEHEQYAIDVAARGIVLLKNDGILPLVRHDGTDEKHNKNEKKSTSSERKKIALIGYNSTNKIAYLANYCGTPSSFINVYDALKAEYGDDLTHSVGVGLIGLLKEGKTAYDSAINCSTNADITIICTGLDSTLEGEAGDTGAGAEGIIGEQGDRASIYLPEIQIKLIEDIAKLGKKIILLNFSGGAVSFVNVEKKVCAILQCWYPGAKGGKAIADVLTGRCNPCGKLPVTFYKSDSDLADFSDYSMTNRTYRYFKGEPQYPFGYGLSYTNFKYDNIRKDGDVESALTLSATVANLGDYDGEDVTQLYMSYPKSEKNQPMIKLLNTKRVSLKKDEIVTVTFVLTKDDFIGYDDNGAKKIFSGEYELHIGGGQPKYSDCATISVVIKRQP